MRNIPLILETTYEIKIEAPQDYKESLFRDVYRKASSMVEEIVENNQKLVQKKYDEEMPKEQICNLIAFLGDRGSGKSSVLVSFCKFLKKFGEYSSEEGVSKEKWDAEIKSLLEKGKKDKFTFSVLKMIDATLLESKETIVGVVLARMLEMVEKREKYLGRNGQISNHAAEQIRNLKIDIGKVYQCMHPRSEREDYDENAPILIVKALSHSWNLRKSFEELVEKFNRYMVSEEDEYGSRYRGENYLVIPIDDIDMNVDKCREMLEMIRKYLMVPRVILLLNFNYEQLELVCKNYYRRTLFPVDKRHGNFRESIQETVNSDFKTIIKESRGENDQKKTQKITELTREYLEKVIPSGRKIYMPQLYQFAGVIQKQVIVGEFKADGLKDKIKQDSDDQEHWILLKPEVYICALLRFYTGIVCLPHERNDYLYPESLRRLNNFIKEFLKLKCLNLSNGQLPELYRLNLDWLFWDTTNRFLKQYVEEGDKEVLEAYLKDIQDEAGSVLLQMLMVRAGDGGAQWQEVIRWIDAERIRREYLSYGDYLQMLSIVKTEHFIGENAMVCWHLLISMKCAQFYLENQFQKEDNKNTSKNRMRFVDDIWGNWDNWFWFRATRENKPIYINDNKSISRSVEVVRIKGYDAAQDMKENGIEISDAVKEYFMIRIFLDLEADTNLYIKDYVIDGELILGFAENIKIKFQAGKFLSFVWDYEKNITTFVREVKKFFIDEQIEKAAEDFKVQMKKWSEEYGTKALVPFYSTQFMERVQRRFYNKKLLIGDVEAEVHRLLQIMEDALADIDILKEAEGGRSAVTWDQILETNQKRADYPAISSCVKAFRECPVVKILRGEDKEEASAGRIYQALRDILDCLTNKSDVLEDTRHIRDFM